MSLSFTFGVELEFIFAFREDRLRHHLNRHSPDARIVKSVDRSAPGLRQPGYGQLEYTSWALSNAGGNPLTIEPLVDGYRAYLDEPLHLVKELAQRARPGAYIHSEMGHKKQTEFPDWAICNDRSLTGLAKAEMIESLPDRISSPAEAEKFWDSWGAELVSPPFEDLSRARDDISALVGALSGSAGDDFGATTSDKCGLHVHVGLPDGSPIPLRTLQHLAYLLVIFEEEISSLHPAHRRMIDSPEIATNRENFYSECPEPVSLSFTDQVTGQVTTKLMEPVFQPLSEIRSLLFETVSKAADPLARLNAFMGRTKGRIVNFAYLSRKDGGPSTVEFRQHAGSLDVDAIMWWVEFCTSLVRLAHECAGRDDDGLDGVEGCFIRAWDEKICIEDLWQRMNFPEAGRSFYRQRIEQHAGDPDLPEPVGIWREYEEFPKFEEFTDEGIVIVDPCRS